MVSSHPESSPAPLTARAGDSEAGELRGGLLMSLSMCCFILNDTMTKLLSTKVGIGEFVFLRGLFATAMIFGLVTVSGHVHRIRSAFDRDVVIRALLDLWPRDCSSPRCSTCRSPISPR